jgi:purine nucleosidase
MPSDGRTHNPNSRASIILDCDPGIDDALAIALAVDHCEVLGLTTVGGNVGVVHTTRNAGSVLALVGRSDIPVHSGADDPLRGPLPNRAEEYHGETGLGDATVPDPEVPIASEDAVGFIIETASRQPGLWLVPTGPLTNLALAFRADPALWKHLAGISWMGGSTTGGNVTPGAEFNAWADPEAADEVFRYCAQHQLELRMAGLNVTHEVTIDEVFVDGLRGHPTGDVFADLIGSYLARYRDVYSLRGAAVHDALAVIGLTHPQWCTFRPFPVAIDTSDGPNRGRTTIDDRPLLDPATPHVQVMIDADEAAIVALLRLSLMR